jgi:hypothetical protein
MTLARLYSALVDGEITADEFSQLASAEFGLSDRTIDQLVDSLVVDSLVVDPLIDDPLIDDRMPVDSPHDHYLSTRQAGVSK